LRNKTIAHKGMALSAMIFFETKQINKKGLFFSATSFRNVAALIPNIDARIRLCLKKINLHAVDFYDKAKTILGYFFHI
jgi:hypothetical protein